MRKGGNRLDGGTAEGAGGLELEPPGGAGGVEPVPAGEDRHRLVEADGAGVAREVAGGGRGGSGGSPVAPLELERDVEDHGDDAHHGQVAQQARGDAQEQAGGLDRQHDLEDRQQLLERLVHRARIFAVPGGKKQ